jgi:hypothetical protein
MRLLCVHEDGRSTLLPLNRAPPPGCPGGASHSFHGSGGIPGAAKGRHVTIRCTDSPFAANRATLDGPKRTLWGVEGVL